VVELKPEATDDRSSAALRFAGIMDVAAEDDGLIDERSQHGLKKSDVLIGVSTL
jgi:hypothetical protein